MRFATRLVLFSLLYMAGASIGFAHPLSAADSIPKVSVTPVALNFGRVAVSNSKQLSVVITNTSTGAFTLTDSVGGLGSPFAVDSGGGVSSLDSGAARRVYLSFKPLFVGQFSDSLVITTNSDSAHQRIIVYLSGTGFVPDTVARILVSPTILDYGIVYTGQSKPLNVTIKNVTNTGLQLNGNVVNAHAPFFVTVGLGNFLLDSGASKSLTVQCAPTDTGTFRDSIVINSNADDANRRIVVILRAHVHSADELLPKIYLSTTSLDFGTFTIHSAPEVQLSMTIKNVSDTQRTLIMNLLFPHPPFTVSGINDHVELAQNQAQDLTVHFDPPLIGTYKDSIIVISNAAKSRIPVYLYATVITTQDVSLEATDAATEVQVSPNPSTNVIVVKFYAHTSDVVRCRLFDETGRQIRMSDQSTVNVGENTLAMEVSSLPAGVYHGVIEGSQTRCIFKIAIVR
ncbi:MAG: choice-of-anchor D domain-containing protein [Bacteroidetes bacterium]|nr:choice-of-anchor D domain-containing protein [Bacteroidota bacterium]